MLAAIVALAVVLTPAASRFTPAMTGQLPNGARIFKPADSVSVREATPEMFERLAVRMQAVDKTKLLDVYMSQDAFAYWKTTGDIKGVAGANTLLALECLHELPKEPAERKRSVTELAEALRSLAEKKNRTMIPGVPSMQTVFGPEAGDDRIIMIAKAPHAWATHNGHYLLSSLTFWPEGRCLTLMLNGEDDGKEDALRTQKRMTEMFADYTLELVNEKP